MYVDKITAKILSPVRTFPFLSIDSRCYLDFKSIYVCIFFHPPGIPKSRVSSGVDMVLYMYNVTTLQLESLRVLEAVPKEVHTRRIRSKVYELQSIRFFELF